MATLHTHNTDETEEILQCWRRSCEAGTRARARRMEMVPGAEETEAPAVREVSGGSAATGRSPETAWTTASAGKTAGSPSGGCSKEERRRGMRSGRCRRLPGARWDGRKGRGRHEAVAGFTGARWPWRGNGDRDVDTRRLGSIPSARLKRRARRMSWWAWMGAGVARTSGHRRYCGGDEGSRGFSNSLETE